MRLIINADDFGLTMNVSRGILEGMKKGIITDTSAIANTDDFQRCAALALKNGLNEMGLHCLLTMGEPVLPAEKIPSLVDKDGRFYPRDIFMEKDVNMDEVEAELEAQISRLVGSGLKMNHIDSHHGVMLKSKDMTELFCRIAKKYQVPIRNEWSRTDKGQMMDNLKKMGIKATDMLYFNHGIPYHTVQDLLKFLEYAYPRYETVEIGCHPGYSDDTLRRISVLNDDREKELETVKDQRITRYIEEKEIILISYSKM